jgi:diacylglycerol kinase family enzyme
VGGDGTVHAYANLGLPALPPAALLPAGRANNIARALGIPVDWTGAAELAVRGRPAAVDALEVVTPDRRLFAVEGVSGGFHAAARHRYNGENSADLAAGVRALVTELAAFRPHQVSLRADGAPAFEGPAAQVFLSNLPLFGFGFRVDPMADPADGRLEAIVLGARTRRGVVKLLAAARQGTHLEREGVRWSRATRAQIESPLPLVADAQPLGVTTATVTVVPGRLRLIAPEPRP